MVFCFAKKKINETETNPNKKRQPHQSRAQPLEGAQPGAQPGAQGVRRGKEEALLGRREEIIATVAATRVPPSREPSPVEPWI